MNDPKTPKGWTAIKRHIKDWDTNRLTALLKDLYDSSTANRTFLDARIKENPGPPPVPHAVTQPAAKPISNLPLEPPNVAAENPAGEIGQGIVPKNVPK